MSLRHGNLSDCVFFENTHSKLLASGKSEPKRCSVACGDSFKMVFILLFTS